MSEALNSLRELVGRSDDVRKFKRLLFDTDVLVFTGASGVGKTSMLRVGLVPELDASGYTVIQCSKWTQRSEDIADISVKYEEPEARADRLLRALLGENLPALAQLGLDDGDDLLTALNSSYRDKCVVILDQFEELMRYQPDACQWVLRWIELAASHTKIRIVVSLRVEHEHQLNGASGLRLGPFSQKRFELSPITQLEHIRTVIEGPNDPEAEHGFEPPVISAGAKRKILSAWEKAGLDESGRGRGLLHLQALLLVLWIRGEGRCIEARDIAKQFPRLDGTALFQAALVEAVDVSVGKCSEACASAGIPLVLTARTKHYVRSMSAHLSSGGFKVDLSREALAQLVVLRDGQYDLAEDGRHQGEQARAQLATLVDASMSDAELMKLTPENDWLVVERERFLPAEAQVLADRGDITAGVLLGASPVESLLEEYRAFYFATEWLRLSELIRITTPEESKTMVSLVHDLFGAGLNEWSVRSAGTSGGVTAEDATHQFSALRGVRMSWKNDIDAASLGAGSVFVNLRWKYCDVAADFVGVTFVNCDFQGTVFRDCIFDGVQFVNCTLDDVELLDCTVQGEPEATFRSDEIPESLRKKLGSQPSFFVGAADSAEAKTLTWYQEPRDLDSTGHRIYSEPGVAAVASTSQSSPTELPFAPQPGGLTMFGGRLSSLKIRNCTFARKGKISLRHVAGTSVELAEQTQVKLSMFDVALRGLTVTRPIEHDAPAKPRDFVLDFTESHLINTWFGVGLRGSATFDWCMVWQVFNAADRKAFKVKMPAGRQYGVVNVEPLFDKQRLPMTETSLGYAAKTDETPEWVGSREVEKASRKIDYRRYSGKRADVGDSKKGS